MPHFDYPCPDCRATTSLHDADCQFEGTPWVDVERAYVDIISVLTGGPCDEETLRREVPGEWGALQQSALSRLKRDERISEAKSGVLRLLTAEEFREEVSEPTHEPMRTLFTYGSVPGCHDNAVFAMIAWYEMVGLSWPETRENVVEWLRETGTWDRGGFEEATPAELVEKKRHVYDAGYGWKEKATSAKRVIDRYRA